MLNEPIASLRVVQSTDFKHLDLAYYENHQRRLEGRDFKFVCDMEDLSLERFTWTQRTFMRFLASRDGFITANIYQLRPNWIFRMRGLRGVRVIDFETQFSDGSWVCTSNAENAVAGSYSRPIDSLFLPDATALDELLATHTARVRSRGGNPVSITTLDDVIRSQTQQQVLKASDDRRSVSRTEEQYQGDSTAMNDQDRELAA